MHKIKYGSDTKTAMHLSLILMWWLRKHKDLTTNEKIEKLYEIIQDQHITVDTLYEKIRSRELQLNTKGFIDRV